MARQAFMMQQQQHNLALLAQQQQQQQQQFTQAMSQSALSMAGQIVAPTSGAGSVQAMSATPDMNSTGDMRTQSAINGNGNG
ncbi:hypothetical protein IWW52_005706, partial [Coemansia sp. RSA 2704]